MERAREVIECVEGGAAVGEGERRLGVEKVSWASSVVFVFVVVVVVAAVVVAVGVGAKLKAPVDFLDERMARGLEGELTSRVSRFSNAMWLVVFCLVR